MDRVRRPHAQDHRHLNEGAKPAEVLKHVLEWHLKDAIFLRADIIGIFIAHGFKCEAAERLVELMIERGELKPVGQGFWCYEPGGGGA